MAANAWDDKRIQHINHLMNDIHASSNQIYEHLMDRDYDSLKQEATDQIKRLRLIIDSVQDEV
jgi:hypothetical protein|tara:strand:- start:460 stop:648 length:189 start_codon:yes stop_codon:yes gene_type:complete